MGVDRHVRAARQGSAAGAPTAPPPPGGAASAPAAAPRGACRCCRPAAPGRPPCARTAAMSELVVVLPLVPVTPMVIAGHSRRNRSTSLTTGTRPSASSAASAARSRGSVVGKRLLIEGEVATSAWPARTAAGSTSGPSRSITDPVAQRRDGVPELGRLAGRRRPSPGRPGRPGSGPARCRCGRGPARPPGGPANESGVRRGEVDGLGHGHHRPTRPVHRSGVLIGASLGCPGRTPRR